MQNTGLFLVHLEDPLAAQSSMHQCYEFSSTTFHSFFFPGDNCKVTYVEMLVTSRVIHVCLYSTPPLTKARVVPRIMTSDF